jgi:hypothetical protein
MGTTDPDSLEKNYGSNIENSCKYSDTFIPFIDNSEKLLFTYNINTKTLLTYKLEGLSDFS